MIPFYSIYYSDSQLFLYQNYFYPFYEEIKQKTEATPIIEKHATSYEIVPTTSK